MLENIYYISSNQSNSTSMWKSTYLFYDVMKYPIPFNKEFFAYEEILMTVKKPGDVPFSRWKKCPSMQSFVDHVNKLWWLWKSLPFVDAIYLSNSMTFNCLKEDSDIDLCIVVSPGRMRLARSWSNIALLLLWLRRRRSYTYKKFNLNFYIERNSLNLQSIKYNHCDPYLIYRIAHLVPLYQRLDGQHIDMYEHNYWLREYLPTFPMEHVIQLWTTVHVWWTSTKRVVERILWWRLWDAIERCIKIIQLPFLLWKKKHLWPLWESMIISDHMLKFHMDKRREYAMKWKIAWRG